MISVAVCSGDRTCSHTAAATSPNAKPARPATSADTNVAPRKSVRSRAVPSIARFPQKASSAWMADHLTGRLRFPRVDPYTNPDPAARSVVLVRLQPFLVQGERVLAREIV